MRHDNPNIFNIQRFCTHDGPGIRTVVFLKGCPLRCQWCSNPESQLPETEIFFDERKCIRCGRCVDQCPESIPVGMQGVDPRCTLCGICVRVCPSKALELTGKEASISEILEEVIKDEQYYRGEGGVTISGGEPLLHSEFVCRLADEIKQYGYHLALETTGLAEWEAANRVFSRMNLILYDMKLMDDEKHKNYTGVSNRLILQNAEKAAEKGYPMIIRVPLMRGINDDEDNVKKLADFCGKIGVGKVEFLPYHNFGESKYTLLRRAYACEAVSPSLEKRLQLAEILEEKGITVKVGN